MAITRFKFLLPMMALSSILAGCGLTQSVSNSTVSATKAMFYQQVTTLHLDFSARSASNNNPSGVALSTVVRVYQLKDRKAFDSADYRALSVADSQEIKADLLATRDIRLPPEGAYSLEMPMEKEAQYVAVVALFLAPEIEQNTWRVVIERDQLDPDKPRKLELNNNRLVLQPLKKD